MAGAINILGFAGSLRKSSYNAATLRAAIELAPPEMSIEIFDLMPIPLYNQDVQDAGFPEPVRIFKDKIARADALLIVTPEYNYSFSGVIKNAIDWASRPPADSPLAGKPVAIMGASQGMGGTIRAQMHLRQVLMSVNVLALSRPEVFIPRAQEKFDASGKLIEEATRNQIRKQLAALIDWTRKVSAK